ncbi:hypothetical protein [Burkholderia paludis]|uniref:hypothetical protein n=1 Tax=Burkholderia TaxID=32008 RepID=UPI00158281DF
MKKTRAPDHDQPFPAAVISLAVRRHSRLRPGLRDTEERLADTEHVFVKASAKNRAASSHQPTRERERHMQGLPTRSPLGLSSRASDRPVSISP